MAATARRSGMGRRCCCERGLGRRQREASRPWYQARNRVAALKKNYQYHGKYKIKFYYISMTNITGIKNYLKLNYVWIYL
jgi:hypothetical protein